MASKTTAHWGGLKCSVEKQMAEREGFEPTVVFSYSRFPGVRLKPLSHLSAEGRDSARIGGRCANGFCGVFEVHRFRFHPSHRWIHVRAVGVRRVRL
jgi:hypothetical protein